MRPEMGLFVTSSEIQLSAHASVLPSTGFAVTATTKSYPGKENLQLSEALPEPHPLFILSLRRTADGLYRAHPPLAGGVRAAVRQAVDRSIYHEPAGAHSPQF